MKLEYSPTDTLTRTDRRSDVVLTRIGVPLLQARMARTFLGRLRGLLGYPPLGSNDALILFPCRSVHTYGMRYNIDVVFLDWHGQVLKLTTLSPSSAAMCFKSTVVVEMAAGTAQRIGLKVGQVLVPGDGPW